MKQYNILGGIDNLTEKQENDNQRRIFKSSTINIRL